MSEATSSIHYGDKKLERDSKHKYTLDGQPLDGVTSACDEINDGKANAMSYWGADTFSRGILSRFPESGVLSIEEYNSIAVDSRKELGWYVRDAASIGTEAHKWIEEYIKNKLLFLPAPHMPPRYEAARAVEAFLRWEDDHKIHYIRTEQLVVSLKHLYAGQMDLVAEVDGIKCQVDFKTSNSFRDQYRLQTAAYSNAYEEEYEEPLRKRIVLMLPKETGKFFPVDLPESDYEYDLQGFLNALGVYRWVKRKNELYPRKKSRTRK